MRPGHLELAGRGRCGEHVCGLCGWSLEPPSGRDVSKRLRCLRSRPLGFQDWCPLHRHLHGLCQRPLEQPGRCEQQRGLHCLRARALEPHSWRTAGQHLHCLLARPLELAARSCSPEYLHRLRARPLERSHRRCGRGHLRGLPGRHVPTDCWRQQRDALCALCCGEREQRQGCIHLRALPCRHLGRQLRPHDVQCLRARQVEPLARCHPREQLRLLFPRVRYRCPDFGSCGGGEPRPCPAQCR
mmetsp:Transcript_31694/g.90941  ORF Transcript_31694/g.90941 Transcript_31694/m.90941 type:complete len:243 (-) Transcript_31694:843-1571(-)